MKMKLTLIVAFFAIFTFTSCEDNPLEGTFGDETGIGSGGVSVGTNSFYAKLDNVEFVEDVISVATVDNGTIEYISIVGTKTVGEQIGLSIPVTHAVGDYNFTEFLELNSVSGSYIVSGGAQPAFPGTLTITEKTATRISGNFSFTSSPFVGTGTTYEITEGTFSVSY